MPITLHEIPPSPNNIKVRIGLNYKGIPFERRPIPMQPGVPPSQSDRSSLTALTRQPFTPVLEHDGIRMFDSSAILRYLEANFPETPTIVSPDYNTMREIERWESFGRTQANQPVSIIFGQAMSEAPDPSECQRACQLAHQLTAATEERLVEHDWLATDHLSIGDIVVAPLLFYAMVPDAAAAANPIARLFQQHLDLGPERERTRAWVQRVMAYDQ